MPKQAPTLADDADPTNTPSSRTPALSPAGGGVSRGAHSSPLHNELKSTDPAIPETERPSPGPETANSRIRKILLANPLFPKFYADVVISSRPNSNLAKILRAHYPKILNQVKFNMANSSCTHIKVTGVRCGSPALRGEQFCYFHQRVHRGVRTPPQARLHPIAVIEDEESIQMALMEVINALMRNTIDLKRATLILRALHIAVKNARRVKFNASSTMVHEVPEFAGQAAPLSEQAEIAEALNIPRYNPAGPTPPRVRTTAELIRDGVIRPRHVDPATQKKEKDEMIAHHFGYPNAEAHAAALIAQEGVGPHAAALIAQSINNVGADAPVRPGPAQPVRTPARQLHDQTSQTNKKPPTNVKTPNPQQRRNGTQRATAG